VDAFEALEVAGRDFRRRLVAVRAENLGLPTPCEHWCVRDLLNHMVGGQRRYIMLLGGAATAEVEATRALDHLGSDPVAAFDAAHVNLSKAFLAPGALDAIVHHRGGDRTGRDLLLMRTVEYTVHGWDLSRAIGLDESIDGRLAEYLLAEVASACHLWDGPRGAFTARITLEVGSTTQAQLLSLTGRRESNR